MINHIKLWHMFWYYIIVYSRISFQMRSFKDWVSNLWQVSYCSSSAFLQHCKDNGRQSKKLTQLFIHIAKIPEKITKLSKRLCKLWWTNILNSRLHKSLCEGCWQLVQTHQYGGNSTGQLWLCPLRVPMKGTVNTTQSHQIGNKGSLPLSSTKSTRRKAQTPSWSTGLYAFAPLV